MKSPPSKVIKEIRRVIMAEARALRTVGSKVGPDYAKAVEWFHRCRGKVVTTGVGKSGLVAEKIAATLSSTGTPAVYLDPLHALHGSLGLIGQRDVVLVIGKSGDSQEVNSLLPRLKGIGARVIALTANPSSYLARHASLVLHVPISEEACPLNLAPTTSTTAALAVGDALAVALMGMRGFKADEFARNHPAGALGRKLSLTARDIMRSGEDNPLILAGDSVSRMLIVMTEKRAGAASVVDGRGKLLGLVTDFDVRRALEKGKNIFSMRIRDVMNKRPVTVRPDVLAAKAVRIMEDRKAPFNVLPVTDGRGRAIGMLQIHDLRAVGM